MTLSPECLIYWASGDFLSGVDTEIDTESHGELFFFDFYHCKIRIEPIIAKIVIFFESTYFFLLSVL